MRLEGDGVGAGQSAAGSRTGRVGDVVVMMNTRGKRRFIEED